jgi:hypothetical protein
VTQYDESYLYFGAFIIVITILLGAAAALLYLLPRSRKWTMKHHELNNRYRKRRKPNGASQDVPST